MIKIKNHYWTNATIIIIGKNYFLKSLTELLQYCFCFMFWVFGCEACGILASRPGIEAAPPTLEGQVLNPRTTREVPRQELLINTKISRKTYDEK